MPERQALVVGTMRLALLVVIDERAQNTTDTPGRSALEIDFSTLELDFSTSKIAFSTLKCVSSTLKIISSTLKWMLDAF